MRRADAVAALAITSAWCLPGGAAAAVQQSALDVIGHTTSVSGREATLEFQLAGGGAVRIALRDGTVEVDDRAVGAYQPGGPLDRSFRDVLSRAGRLASPDLLAAVRNWEATGLAPNAAAARAAILDRLAALTGREAPLLAPTAADTLRSAPGGGGLAIEIPELAANPQLAARLARLGITVRDGKLDLGAAMVRVGDRTVRAGDVIDGSLVALQGNVAVYGHVTGDVLAIRGDVVLHRRSTVDGNVVVLGGSVTDAGGRVRGQVVATSLEDGRRERVRRAGAAPRSAIAQVASGTAGLLGAFVALAAIGFGFTFFAPRELEVVADTVARSFGRSFLAGLFAHPLIPLAFLLAMLGLVLTIVGILIVPFAAVALTILLAAAAVGGYLAVARAAGEIYLRRRMARGSYVGRPDTYLFLLVGIGALLLIWVPAVFLGWVPVVGGMLAAVALLVTWVLATAGLGAVVLSRGGIRGTFARRFAQQMSDEYLWMTPEATPIRGPKDREALGP